MQPDDLAASAPAEPGAPPAAYLAAAFIVLKGADIVVPAMPRRLLGPARLAWVFDINRGGIQRTAEPPATLLPGDRLVRRLFQIAGVLLSMFAARLLGWSTPS